MTSKERAELRAKANPLEPIFQIGKDGLSDNLINQISDALDVRELLKIRVHLETAPQTPKELASQLAPALNAEIIQVIGGIIVIYRKADSEKANARNKTKKKATVRKAKPKKVKIRGMRKRDIDKQNRDGYGIRSRGGRP